MPKHPPNIWLMKTEPDVFSFDDLMKAPKATTHWEGVRNYQARNFMRDQFKVGDLVLVYHSNTDEPGIVGLAEVARAGYPDPSALDPKSEYYDEKSAKDKISRWVMVDIRGVRRLKKTLTLALLRKTRGLEDMLVLQKGQRLSVQPVKAAEWAILERLGS